MVIAYGLCPFAQTPFENNHISYVVEPTEDLETALFSSYKVAKHLLGQNKDETSLLLFTKGFSKFKQFLDLVDLASDLLDEQNYSENLLLAHFHPLYLFADSTDEDAANYTNRSVYPMLHFLKQTSVSKAARSNVDLSTIPSNNVTRLRALGKANLASKLKRLSV